MARLQWTEFIFLSNVGFYFASNNNPNFTATKSKGVFSTNADSEHTCWLDETACQTVDRLRYLGWTFRLRLKTENRSRTAVILHGGYLIKWSMFSAMEYKWGQNRDQSSPAAVECTKENTCRTCCLRSVDVQTMEYFCHWWMQVLYTYCWLYRTSN